MNLDDIRSGSLCVLDTNILLYAEQGISAQAQRLLQRCAKGDISVTMPQIIWQEVTHKMMLAEALMKGLINGTGLAAKLGGNPESIGKLSIYQPKIRALADLGVAFEPCIRADLLESAFSLQSRYDLLPNEATLLAVALRLKADVLVSHDKAFGPVTEIALHAPSDLRIGTLQ